jgi:hypothetical protein
MLNEEFKLKLEELQSKLLPYTERKELDIYKNTDINKRLPVDERFEKCKFQSAIGNNIIVTNYGRIWVDGRMDFEKNNGVYVFRKNGKVEQIHRLIAGNYCPLIYCKNRYWDKAVHHIDGNGFNNQCFNLLWVTYSQHTMIHLKGIWYKENYQLEFKGNKYCLNKGDVKQFDGEFEIADNANNSWDNTNNKMKEVQLEIKFGVNKNRGFFLNEYLTEMDIKGEDLFSGEWKKK